MKVTKAPLRVQPRYQVSESLNLDGKDGTDIQALSATDTFFLIDKIEKENVYNDPYFVGLKDILDKLEKQYVYLPVFCYTKNPLRLLKTFKILAKQNTPVLTEYQLCL